MKKENDKEKEREWVTFASKLFCTAFFLLLFYLLLKYALSALLPFAAAYLFSLVIVPAAARTARKTRLPQKFCAAVYLTFALFLFGLLLYFGTRRVASELTALLEEASRGEGSLAEMLSALNNAVDKIASADGFLGGLFGNERFGELTEGFGDIIAAVSEKIFSSLASSLGKLIGNTVSAAPSFLLAVVVTLIAAYYFCIDHAKISIGIKKLIPEKHMNRVTFAVLSAKCAIKRYAKAYLLLMALTFAEVFAGLSFLKVEYSFLIALGVALVDILPVLGVGTVLVPWALGAFILRDMRMGIGILILYGVITIVRQIAEPHIIGSSIGLHPTAALFSTYVGLKLFGILGMIFGPAAAFVICEILNGGRTKNDGVDSIEHGR